MRPPARPDTRRVLGCGETDPRKPAIVLFVRNKNFSDVLAQIVPLVEEHRNYKKTLPNTDETDFRFVFGQREDRNREVHLAVLAFPVPMT